MALTVRLVVLLGVENCFFLQFIIIAPDMPLFRTYIGHPLDLPDEVSCLRRLGFVSQLEIQTSYSSRLCTLGDFSSLRYVDN